MVREVTQNMWTAIQSDVMPQTMATLVDFGLDPMGLQGDDPTHRFGALQWAVIHGGVTIQQLDDALGDGPKLTALVDIEGNPYKCKFTTAWDDMPPDPED